MGPLEAEAKALEESLLFAWDVGVQDVLFECDFKVVCDAVTGCSDPLSVIGKVVWIEETPSMVESAVAHDVAILSSF